MASKVVIRKVSKHSKDVDTEFGIINQPVYKHDALDDIEDYVDPDVLAQREAEMLSSLPDKKVMTVHEKLLEIHSKPEIPKVEKLKRESPVITDWADRLHNKQVKREQQNMQTVEAKVSKKDKPLEAVVYKEFDFHYTKDYNMFNRVNSNRQIMEKHVNNIVEAIKLRNLLHLVPIICDAQYNVLDGQHRLAAAKKLKIPIYYVVDETVTKADIAMLNTNKQNWKIIDYINFYSVEGNAEYEKLLNVMKDNPKLTPVNTCLLLGSNDRFSNSKLIKSGTLTLPFYKQGLFYIQVLNDWFNYFEFAYDREFLLMMRKAVDIGKYDHKFMMKRIEKYKYLIKRCHTPKEYQQMIAHIYNIDEPKFVKLFEEKI